MARTARDILDGKNKSSPLDIPTMADYLGPALTQKSIHVPRVLRSEQLNDVRYVWHTVSVKVLFLNVFPARGGLAG